MCAEGSFRFEQGPYISTEHFVQSGPAYENISFDKLFTRRMHTRTHRWKHANVKLKVVFLCVLVPIKPKNRAKSVSKFWWVCIFLFMTSIRKKYKKQK